jgi:hypothetical protein
MLYQHFTKQSSFVADEVVLGMHFKFYQIHNSISSHILRESALA